MDLKASAIIVTHNDNKVLSRCLQALSEQRGVALEVIVVDSGSDDRTYLHSLQEAYLFTLIETDNVGYGCANNIGYRATDPTREAVVFLNPDTFLPEDYLENALGVLARAPKAAIVSGILAGYDPEKGVPTGRYDSTGIFRKWYGRWYDRDQGVAIREVQRPFGSLTAVCGALLVCRRAALLPFADEVFDEDFFLYKEDIELSIRLRKQGWELLFEPTLCAYHCRGWNRDRQSIPRDIRLTAADNEVLLYRKHPSPYMLWAFLKKALVRLGDF